MRTPKKGIKIVSRGQWNRLHQKKNTAKNKYASRSPKPTSTQRAPIRRDTNRNRKGKLENWRTKGHAINYESKTTPYSHKLPWLYTKPTKSTKKAQAAKIHKNHKKSTVRKTPQNSPRPSYATINPPTRENPRSKETPRGHSTTDTYHLAGNNVCTQYLSACISTCTTN